MRTDGDVYQTLLREAAQEQPYNTASKECVETAVDHLLNKETSGDRPGMLLGMIQSGKTKTFLGVIALAIDNGFNLFVVLTKGTKALSTQTYERLKQTFAPSIDREHLQIFDIMTLNKLSGLEQQIPLVLVVKKNKDNLTRLMKLLFETYPDLGKRKALIIDDEADYASLGFKRSKAQAVELQKIMEQINQLRSQLNDYSFLQVTATPYSLYLQPTDLPIPPGHEFKPIRPAFTALVPIHDQYIGGKFYFEESLELGAVASFLYESIPPAELEILHHDDRRRFKIEEALTSPAVYGLRSAVMNFIVGGIIRRMQATNSGQVPTRYSFIIHTESARDAHRWQENVIEELVEQLRKAAQQPSQTFVDLVNEAYHNLAPSIHAGDGWLPEQDVVLCEAQQYLPSIQVEKVNSENDVKNLLDRQGQLELRNRLNIFIGGQILDRGLTIGNLIGFYYGRRTNRFQQDTVLQHSRMYGARPLADITVTRFYTTPDLYNIMHTINDFDAGLRQAFLDGGHDAGVVFIRQDGGRIVPCSPNKVLVSTLTTLRAGKRLLPVGFQTGYKTHILKHVEEIDQIVQGLLDSNNPDAPVLIDVNDAQRIVKCIEKTYETAKDSYFEWDVKAFLASMEYVSRSNQRADERGKIYLLARRDREAARIRSSGRFFDAPDAANVEGRIAHNTAIHSPMLVLFRQKGEKDKGWRDCPFWWPVLYMPQRMGTVVFASDVYDYDTDNPIL